MYEHVAGGEEMEFLMQPIRRPAVLEEVNDNEVPMEPLHYPHWRRWQISCRPWR